MQSCPVDVLANIGSFLPWRDRLQFEKLSTRFRHLPCKPIKSTDFSLKISADVKQKYFYFEFTPKNGRTRRLLQHEVGVTVERFLPIDKVLYTKTVSDYFDFSVNLLNKLVSFFSIQCYDIWDEPEETYKILTELFTKKRQLISDNLTINIKMPEKAVRSDNYADEQERSFGAETWNFLECLEDVHSFRIEGPEKLRPSEVERFRHLSFWKTAKTIQIDFGFPEDFNCNIDFKIDNEFLQSLVDRKASTFTTNTICHITTSFILEYIKNHLSGSHALCCLDITGVSISKTDLLSLGFDVDPESYLEANKVLDCRNGEPVYVQVLVDDFATMITANARGLI